MQFIPDLTPFSTWYEFSSEHVNEPSDFEQLSDHHILMKESTPMRACFRENSYCWH